MRSPVITLHGIAVVQISASGAAVRDVCHPADFVLAISETAGRLGSVAFWSGDQVGVDELHGDQFHGRTWSLIGTGLMVQKATEHLRLGKNDAFGVAALWPVISEAAETFARVGEKNAVASVELEAGCQAFGIFRSLSDPTVFSLVEVFDDAISFNRHMETEHFQQFAKFARPKYVGDHSQTVKGTARWI